MEMRMPYLSNEKYEWKEHLSDKGVHVMRVFRWKEDVRMRLDSDGLGWGSCEHGNDSLRLKQMRSILLSIIDCHCLD
jgi:hypothetical protein